MNDLLLLAGLGAVGYYLARESQDYDAAHPPPTEEQPAAFVQVTAGRRYVWTIESSMPGDFSGAFSSLSYSGSNLKLVGYPDATPETIPGTNVTVDVPGKLIQLAANVHTSRSVPLMKWEAYRGHRERILSVKDAGQAE